MSIYLQDPDITLYHGDCLDVLRELPSGSVHMCATSPPFYGLRDYGTGEWEGGDEGCDHVQGLARKDGGREIVRYGSSGGVSGFKERVLQYKDECGKCGATRVDRQIGLEDTPDQWVEHLVQVFREVRRVLRGDGTLWVEIGDSYYASSATGNTFTGGKHASIDPENNQRMRDDKNRRLKALTGYKAKDLLGQPWLLAFALRADGWWLRSEIIWARPNPMPESVTDRPTKSHSTVFLLSKSPRYFYDADAIREPHAQPWRSGTAEATQRGHEDGLATGKPHMAVNGREYNPLGANARSVWTIPTEPTPFAHFATWPQKLVARMIQAGTSERGCCPECGKPWVRDTERGEPTLRGRPARQRVVDSAHDAGSRIQPRQRGHDGTPTISTVGWLPSGQACNRSPVPCVVLDPFAGSGTTLLVARQHGRHSIGIELNPDYCQIAATRLQQLSLLT